MADQNTSSVDSSIDSNNDIQTTLTMSSEKGLFQTKSDAKRSLTTQESTSSQQANKKAKTSESQTGGEIWFGRALTAATLSNLLDMSSEMMKAEEDNLELQNNMTIGTTNQTMNLAGGQKMKLGDDGKVDSDTSGSNGGNYGEGIIRTQAEKSATANYASIAAGAGVLVLGMGFSLYSAKMSMKTETNGAELANAASDQLFTSYKSPPGEAAGSFNSKLSENQKEGLGFLARDNELNLTNLPNHIDNEASTAGTKFSNSEADLGNAVERINDQSFKDTVGKEQFANLQTKYTDKIDELNTKCTAQKSLSSDDTDRLDEYNKKSDALNAIKDDRFGDVTHEIGNTDYSGDFQEQFDEKIKRSRKTEEDKNQMFQHNASKYAQLGQTLTQSSQTIMAVGSTIAARSDAEMQALRAGIDNASQTFSKGSEAVSKGAQALETADRSAMDTLATVGRLSSSGG